jgi:hypothetical protein
VLIIKFVEERFSRNSKIFFFNMNVLINLYIS